jgi:hypothetical protein
MSRTNTAATPRRPLLAARATLVLLACLNLGLMPCALFASTDRACPGCPEAAHGAHGAAHDHAHSPAHASEKRADHSSACTDAGTNCCGVGSIAKAERPQQPVKSADVQLPAIAPPAAAFADIVVLHRDTACATGPPVAPPSLRLHAQFCVYLD